jgi:sulfatase maturation enzyme AslB (radical SAM superfamily)
MNNYFCVLPFFGYEFHPDGTGTHCCLLPKNYDINQIRQQMLDQQRPTACSACWQLEDQGLVSDRTLKNSTLDFYWDRDIRFIEDDARAGKYKPIMIKNVTSNTCNSTCITCSSGASSAWAALDRKMQIIPAPTQSMTQSDIDSNIDYANIVTLNLVGGEPLYEKLNFRILEQLIAHNNTNCFVAITTNGSTSINDRNRKLLANFKNINFNVSIDGVGPVFEYLRFPLKWSDLLDNLQFFKTITDNVNVSYTTSNLNVMYHHNILKWFDEHGLRYHYNPVITPSYFRPGALPLAVKEHIFATQGRTPDLEFFLGTHTEKDEQDFEQMLEVIKKQDAAKGILMEEYLPAFCSMLRALA